MRVYERKEEHLKRVFGEVLLGQEDLCSVMDLIVRGNYARSQLTLLSFSIKKADIPGECQPFLSNYILEI